MAIKSKKNGGFTYGSYTGLVSSSEMKAADKLYSELKTSIHNLEKKLLKKGLLTKDGRKTDALLVWFEFGKLLNKIVNKYNITRTSDEKFFWRSIYDHVSSRVQKGPMPKRSKDWKQNHFRLCALMIRNRNLKSIRQVGNWAIWRDIFDNKKILEDERLFNWTVSQITKLRKKGLGHKKIRLFLYAISRRFRNIDTNFLNDKELRVKLRDIKFKENQKR